MEFLLASGNNHKRDEFEIIFKDSPLEVISPSRSIEVEETGTTLFENALLKAEGYFREFEKPVMSDDSGIFVPALPNKLGVHSARYGGYGLSDSERNVLLLKEIAELDRKAEFRCVLCFYLAPGEVFFFEGRLAGQILEQSYGDKGFGYDPLFAPDGFPPGKSIAQDPEWKEVNSHRYLACREAKYFFAERNCQKQ